MVFQTATNCQFCKDDLFCFLGLVYECISARFISLYGESGRYLYNQRNSGKTGDQRLQNNAHTVGNLFRESTETAQHRKGNL